MAGEGKEPGFHAEKDFDVRKTIHVTFLKDTADNRAKANPQIIAPPLTPKSSPDLCSLIQSI